MSGYLIVLVWVVLYCGTDFFMFVLGFWYCVSVVVLFVAFVSFYCACGFWCGAVCVDCLI